jgi:hypothetical protein
MASYWRSLPGSWQEKLVVLLGVCLMASPWLLGYSASSAATGNAVVIGSIFVIGSIVGIFLDTSYANYVVAFLAFWLTLAARILGYDDLMLATVAQVSFGIAGIVFSFGGVFKRERARLAQSGAKTQPTEQPAPPTPQAPDGLIA